MSEGDYSATEAVEGFEYGNPDVTIGGTEYTVDAWNPTEAGTDIDYTDGFGNYIGTITVKAKVSSSMTIQGGKEADTAKLNIGLRFDYDGYSWTITSKGKSRQKGSPTSVSLTLARGDKLGA